MVENILEVAGPIGGLAALAFLVLAGLGHLFARQVAMSRETVRTLRVALEHDPSPGQIGHALSLWPEAAKYPPTPQRQELVKQATLEERRRADRTELIKGWVRVFLGLAFLGAALYVASLFIKAPPAGS